MVNFVAIDFETANRCHDSACAIGLVRVENNKITAKEMMLINPQTYFLADFTKNVHGLTEEHVKNALFFSEVWNDVKHLLDGVDFIVAHNASFDKSVLYKCCDKYKIDHPDQNFTCSIKAAKACWELSAYSLDKVCEHLGIELNHHEALSDATACAKIMIRAYGQGYKV